MTRNLHRAGCTASGIAAMWLTLCVTGCGIRPAGPGGTSVSTGVSPARTGSVHGGQQPIAGATLQLYAAGNKGNGSAATALIASVVKTDGNGNFTITGLWNCNDTATYGSDPQLYIVATGGNPGISPGFSNGAIALMSALGPCSSLNASTTLNIDEVTTVASVYALAPFMVDVTHVGAADTVALGRAFATVRTLADLSAGSSPGPDAPSWATVPVATINTLADAMASCINSNGGSVCDAFFAATQGSGSVRATETVGAMLQVAHAPMNNAGALFSLTTSQAPFQPLLGGAPTDWTLSVRYTGGGLGGPTAIAMDAQGNAWIANGGGAGVTGLSSQGARLTGGSGYSAGGTIFGAQGIVVDPAGNVWVADTLLSTVVKLTVTGGAVQQSSSFSTDIDGPLGIAVDSQSHVWVANSTGGSVVELASSGQPMGAGALTAGGTLVAPVGVAVDKGGNVWVTDNGAGVVVKFDTNQNLLSGAGFSDQAMIAPAGLGIDAQGQVWVADNGLNAVSRFAASGAAASNSPLSGGGLAMPSAVAVDGSGGVWVTNTGGTGLTYLAPNQSAVGGLGTVSAAAGVAVDASGNVWTANAGDDSVTKFVGLAAPATMPLAAAAGP